MSAAHHSVPSDAATTSPPSSSSPPLLSDRINTATRASHARLNRQIVANFPLVLPPYSPNPTTYASGLAYIAPIYITFEKLWGNVVGGKQQPASAEEAVNEAHEQTATVAAPGQDAAAILQELYLPSLLRSERLTTDLAALCDISPADVEVHLSSLCAAGPLAEFTTHITAAVEAKPHVLLSYAWVMYMALFSGGRYLRATLEEPGAGFWKQHAELLAANPTTATTNAAALAADGQRAGYKVHMKAPEAPADASLRTMPGLQFWNFPGDEDGADLKAAFKATFAKAGEMLSPSEQEDVIAEAQVIFDAMLALVQDLESHGISSSAGERALNKALDVAGVVGGGNGSSATSSSGISVVMGLPGAMVRSAGMVLKPLGLGLLASAGRVLTTSKLESEAVAAKS